MRRSSRHQTLALAMLIATTTLSTGVLAVSVDYRKFSAEALMLMRPTVSVEDREPFREAFLQKLEAMTPAERQAFQAKAMEYVTSLGEADRAALMKDLMSYMDRMTPEELLMLSQQIKEAPATDAAVDAKPASTDVARVAAPSHGVPPHRPMYAYPQRAYPRNALPQSSYTPAPQPGYSPGHPGNHPPALPYAGGYPAQAYGYPGGYARPVFSGYPPMYAPGYGYPGW